MSGYEEARYVAHVCCPKLGYGKAIGDNLLELKCSIGAITHRVYEAKKSSNCICDPLSENQHSSHKHAYFEKKMKFKDYL